MEGVNATLTGFIRDPSEINSTTVEFALLTSSNPQLKPVGQPLCGVTSEANYAMVFTNSGSGAFGRSKVPLQMKIGLNVRLSLQRHNWQHRSMYFELLNNRLQRCQGKILHDGQSTLLQSVRKSILLFQLVASSMLGSVLNVFCTWEELPTS